MLYRFSPALFALLPEILLTVTGVLIMLAEPLLAPGKSRKPLGWLAILGALASGLAAFDQLRVQNAINAFLAFGGTIQVDVFSTFFHMLIAAIVVVTLLASLDYFEKTPLSHAGEYFALVCFGAVGMMLMTSATELLVVFIGLEISSIATYILAGFRKGQATASESSLKYFLLGSFATAFFLYGIALAFGATGSTKLAVIGATFATTDTPRLAFLALAMMIVGLGFKVSAAPFHVWTADVYQGAPAPVVGLMSTAPKAAVFAVLLRVLFATAAPMRGHWLLLIEILAVCSMTIGNLAALTQRDVKRMLAYSSVATAGYILVAYAGDSVHAASAVMTYTAAYAAMNVGAFVVLTVLNGYNERLRTREDFTGLAERQPLLAALLAFFLISLIGIPFTAGFTGKFSAFFAAGMNGAVILVAIALINSGVACFYYLRLVAVMYAKPVSEVVPGSVVGERGIASPVRIAFPAALALAATALATLGLGILPNLILHHTERARPAPLALVTPPTSQ
jgi:NADH-quinone oxidoreductase subunit N